MFQNLDDKFTRFFKALSKHNRKSKKCVFISPVNQMQDFIKNPEIFDINFLKVAYDPLLSSWTGRCIYT